MSTVAVRPSAGSPGPLLALWQTVTRVDRSKENPIPMALRNTLATVLPLAAGAFSGYSAAGSAMATGALNVSYSDSTEPFSSRARRMLTWSVLGALAVYIGGSTGEYHVPAILITACWAMLAGLLTSISQKAGDLGLNTLVSLVVFAARTPGSGGTPLQVTLLVLGGGLLQTLAALVFWPVDRYGPERQAIGVTFRNLSIALRDKDGAALSEPVTGAYDGAGGAALDALGRDRSIEGERLRLLFDQADRVRQSGFHLRRLQFFRTLQKHSAEDDSTPAVVGNGDASDQLSAEIDLVFEHAGRVLDIAASEIFDPDLLRQVEGELLAMEQAASVIRKQAGGAEPTLESDIGGGADVFTGQIRAVARLAARATAEGSSSFQLHEDRHPWATQLGSWRDTLLANLTVQSAAFRHGVRMAVFVGLGDVLSHSLSWQRTYWIPMTVAVVLRPDFTTTFSRGLLRLTGTLVGLLLATGLYHLVQLGPISESVLVFVFMFALRRWGPANYGIFTVALTGLVVFLIAAVGISPRDVVALRGINTLAGGCLALFAYAVWPTWERRRIPEVLAEMLDFTRDYFRAVVESALGKQAMSVSETQQTVDDKSEELKEQRDKTRQRWRRARADAETSGDRMGMEPSSTPDKLRDLEAIMASSRTVAHCIMGLEAGFEGDGEPELLAGEREPLRGFSHDVEFTLYFLAEELRGQPGAAKHRPALRESYRRMLTAAGHDTVPASFLYLETDRLTVALNTLSEQVERFVH